MAVAISSLLVAEEREAANKQHAPAYCHLVSDNLASARSCIAKSERPYQVIHLHSAQQREQRVILTLNRMVLYESDHMFMLAAGGFCLLLAAKQ